ncbi:MAG: GNAT family N-acetyltransferase [Bacteroidota bacterium]
MKLFFSENQPDYSTYTFNYAIYAVKEEQTELPEIYNRGFLPYTGDLRIDQDIFYLARSLRVDLNRFTDTSENRRINRKIQDLAIEINVYEKATFPIDDPKFLSFCMNYAADRFSGNAMTEERLKFVFNKETGSHILTFSSKDQTLGYVLAAIEGNTLHYWFSFFDQAYLKSHSLGKWMMWRTIHWAKERGLDYVYLGTCYGKHSLYKVRDHKGLAFFDGSIWNTDTKVLKELCKTDSEIIDKDRFKLLDSPNSFLKNLP